MVFEDSSQAATPGSRFVGEGFRQEPDFRDPTAPTVPVVPGQMIEPVPEPTITVAKRGAPPNLAFVFDDPEDGEPGRDRMLVHGLWELLLALSVAGLGYLLFRSDSGAFTADGWRTLLLAATVLSLGAMAAALSLRAGAPNLAIGAVAVAAAGYFGQHAGSGFAAPLGIVIGLAAAVGAVQGLVVVGLQVPGWAAGLGTTLAVMAWMGTQSALKFAGYDPTAQAYWWFGAVAAVSVVAGVIGVVSPIRRAVGGFRPVADPARRRPAGAAAITLVATTVSSIIAAVAGVLTVSVARATPSSIDILQVTAFAFGVALLGGTSAYGRRGGIFGTMLTALLVTVSLQYAAHTEPSWPVAGFAAATIGLGLLVTRLVEWFGRPAPARVEDTDEDWAPRVHAATTTTTTVANGWTSLKPPTQTAVGSIWSGDDAWGTTPR